MGNSKELYKITVSSPEFETVGDFLDDQNSVAFSYSNDPEKFLNVVGEDTLTNRQRIENSYHTVAEKIFIGAKASRLPLKVGTILYIEYDKLNELSFVTEGIEVVSTDEPAFKAAQLAKLEADPGYNQVHKFINGKLQKGSSKELYPEVTVWIWCRSLSPKTDEDRELSGQFFDLTPFIQRCQTNMGKNGGNWQIVLPPLVCELDKDRKWIIKETTIDRYVNAKGTSIQREGYLSQGSIFESEDGDELTRSQFLFHNIISTNDLILIMGDTLDMEKEVRYQDKQHDYINKNIIAGRIYDMIGLVDSNTQSVTPGSTDVTINISGRDLSKLFIEDGTYFYALENSQGILKFAGQSEQKNTLINRIFGDGALNFISLYMFSSIELILKFIMQQLANIKVVPDELFVSYFDRVNYRFNETESKFNKLPDAGAKVNQPEHKPEFKREKAPGIWKIIKLVIDKSVSNRRLQDSSFSTANGSLLNFIRTACQEPLVEFFMDTYGDMYNLIVRKPPYDQKSLISLIEGKVNTEDGSIETPPAIIDIHPEDVLQENLSFDDTQVYSWYHFFPQNNFLGDSKTYSLTYLGALFFEEYAQLWGSKPFQHSHPYIPFVQHNNNEKGLGLYEKQAIEDLKYVVESNQYLPFTRKGSLVLNPDRRIKIGNVIRYVTTGEIFFVDSVQHNYQIGENVLDANTTVNVSRGMIEQLIYGVYLRNENDAPRFVSYFNIINTELVFNWKDTVTQVTKRRKIVKPVVQEPTQNVINSALSIAGSLDTGPAVHPLPPLRLLPLAISPITVPILFPFAVLPDGFGNTPIDEGSEISENSNIGIHYLEKYNKYPENKKLFVRFINGINKLGYNVELIADSTNRSFGEQAALHRLNPNNAEAGHSRHERGYAIDITIKHKKTGTVHTKETSKAEWIATGVPALANSLGLQWAGGDGSFGSYIDRVHFEIANGSGQSQAVDEFEEFTVDEPTRGIDRDSIFSNFKVNKFAFNFFLKKLQFDPSYKKVTSRNVYQSGGVVGQEAIVRSVIPTKKKK